MEVVDVYVVMLRCMMVVAVCLLLWVCASHKDRTQQSLLVLQQLQDTQCHLQEVLKRAESFGQWKVKDPQHEVKGRQNETLKKVRCQEETHMAFPTTDASDPSHLSIIGWCADHHLRSTAVTTVTDTSVLPVITPNATVTPGRHRCRRSAFSSSSPLVYSILVEDKQVDHVQPRYSLRSRRSQNL